MTIFLCIILTAVILVQSIFYFGARFRENQADIRRCLRLQTQQILASYNEELLNQYGLYAFDSTAKNDEVFMACLNDSCDATVGAYDTCLLDENQLATGICNYMEVREAGIVTGDIISKARSVMSEIEGNDIYIAGTDGETQEWIADLSDYLNGGDVWDTVIEVISVATDYAECSGYFDDLFSFAEDYREIFERGTSLYLQGESSGSVADSLLDTKMMENTLNTIDSYMGQDSSTLMEYLLVNQYAVCCFDSKLQTTNEGNSSIPEANYLGVPFSELHSTNQCDLEYILTGLDSDTASCGVVYAGIYSLRLAVNFLSLLSDKEKMEIANGIATVISTIIFIVSEGGIYVDPKVIEFIVAGVWAAGQAMLEVNALENGESISFIDSSVITDNPILDEVLQTSYRDYVGLFLLFIPEETKLERMLAVINRDYGEDLSTSVGITSNYLSKVYYLEEGYDLYDY